MVPFQISPSACTSAPGGVEAVVGVVQRVACRSSSRGSRSRCCRWRRRRRPRRCRRCCSRGELVLAGDQVAPRLAHRAALLGGDALVGAGDHAVADGVGVLVADDAHVEAAVGARGVEGAGDRLEEVLVGDAGRAVLERDLVGVVAAEEARAAAGDGAGLGVADLLVAGDAAAAAVVELQVVVLLGEAEVVGVVVHPVVRDEQVVDRGVDVVAAGHELRGVAPAVVPGVGELRRCSRGSGRPAPGPCRPG